MIRGAVLARIGGVGLAAVAAIVALELWLREGERSADAAAARQQEREQAASLALGSARPLVAAGVTARTVVLSDRPGGVPEAAAEWQLLRDGTWAVRRPVPLPSVPGVVELPAFAVALPTSKLASLDATARASLLDFLSVAWRDRPVSLDRLRLKGVDGEDLDRSALLDWLR
jgi:hypothetical protein